MSKGGFVKGNVAENAGNEGGSLEWELRPGGMLVQKRDPEVDAAYAGPSIRVKISYGLSYHHVSISAHSTFGDLKKVLVQDTGLQPEQQRLLYKGKEKDNGDYLHEAGVKDKSKIVLVEDTASWEKRLIELRKNEAAAKACKAVVDVQQLVDKLSGQIATIEAAIISGKKLSDSEFTGPTDLLMCQLLKLEASNVDGDAKVQKLILIRRVQKYVETLDVLKVRNNASNARNDVMKARKDTVKARKDTLKVRNDTPNAVSNTVVTTTWETFGTSLGSANMKPAPPVSEPLLIEWD